MRNIAMLAAVLPFWACEFIPMPEPGGKGEPGRECGECTSDHDCPDGTCDAEACLPWCACPACDVCAGHCVPRQCGGFAGIPCPPGYDCVDDATDDCDPATGADCPGICVPASPTCGDGICDPTPRSDMSGENCVTCPEDCGECCDPSRPPEPEICGDGIDNDCDGLIDEDCDPMMCGGFAGFLCPPGFECVDDPTDDCHPERGGADCPGICVPDDCFCTTEYKPVCGVDGVTYGNHCEADCVGVPVACEGECPCRPGR